jgi:hypothetical protein|tara:strand:+ start:586 stop:1122 length:537 start_codon:yes stop_codon:yes gene_type:complete
MKTFKQYCEADGCWSGYKKVGMKKKNGKSVPNCVPESKELEELNTNQLIKKLAADTIFKKKYTAAVAKVKEIMFKHGPKPRHGKEYYAGKIAQQFGLDPHVLALLVDEQLSEGSESWDDGYERRVVKTTKPEHKADGYEWRIKGKDKDNLSIKLYKTKPDKAEFEKQMKRVAGHEFGG